MHYTCNDTNIFLFVDSSGNPVYTGLYSGPYFDLGEMKVLPHEQLRHQHNYGGDALNGQTNVTSQIGSAAILPCSVKQVGSNTVNINLAKTQQGLCC